METSPPSRSKETPFTNEDSLNIICSYLTLKDRLVLASVSKLVSSFLQDHFFHMLRQDTYDQATDKTPRELVRYNFNRNLKVIRIPSILQGAKEESVQFNFFRQKCITKIEAEGKHFVAFIDNKDKAYVARATEFFPVKDRPNINHEIFKNVRRVFCPGERLFVLSLDGTVTMATPSEDKDKVYANLQMIDWTLRVPVVDMVVSKNYAVFLLGQINSSEIRKLIMLEDLPIEKEHNKAENMKIIAYNIQACKFYIISYPYKEVKSYCVGSNTAYFVNENNELLTCVLTNLNEGQTTLTATSFPDLSGKRIVSVYGGLNFNIALLREDDLLENWNNDNVVSWLRREGFDDYVNIMRVEKIDGKKLVNLEKKYMENVLGITNINIQQKILLSIENNKKISYNKDKLYGWGKNQTGQLGNSMAVFVNKPVNIKLPQLSKNENVIDVVCGWNNTILKTNKNRIFISTQDIKKETEKNEEDSISDEELRKEIEKEKKGERRRKRTENQEEMTGGGKKEKKKGNAKEQRHVEKQKERYEQDSHWVQYKSLVPLFHIGTVKDLLLVIQLGYQPQQSKKKIKTVKEALDKMRWDPNLSIEDFKVGYSDKYIGTLDISVQEYLKSEVKEHRILYFKKNGQIVWHKEDKIDHI